ncbi:MAG TPA: TIGR04282 family arsenosugar biosynthesis glycosyltransferase [Gaiellales bacterium]|jgi:rSAM/selenodomain-associated transferase 1|nr:TIGR04282 family arsenosugar biosynthesis glycosyltransferase [Gaiellales bacterium]
MAMITALVVAKAPGDGRGKTRLVPPLSDRQAASLQEALLLDTIAACRREAEDVRLLTSSEDERAALAALLPATRIEVQRGRGLADALRHGISDHLTGRAVAIISSDLPGLPAGSIAEAAEALAAGADVVLGPAMDGGYWLVAMRAAHEAPFHDIPWSTPAVWAVTLSRCREAGLRVHELQPWRDVDTYADLAACRDELEPVLAPRSARALRELTERGIVGDEAGPQLVASELLAASPWRAVVRDELRRTDGRPSAYTYFAVPRAVFVVAVTRAQELILVRQYRHPVRDWTLEVPAGSVEDGESALEAAQRELFEEVGGSSSSWRHLSTFYSSSAHLSLRSDAFLASEVELLASPQPDEEESLVTVRLPLGEALARVRSGGFVEGQTALAILLATPFLEETTLGTAGSPAGAAPPASAEARRSTPA